MKHLVEYMDEQIALARKLLDRRDMLLAEAGIEKPCPDFAVAKSSPWYEVQQRKLRQSVQ